MPKVPKKATFGTTIGTFQGFSIVFQDGNQDASEITSRRILYYVATYLLLRRDVANTTSGRIFYGIRMYLLLRQDVFFFLLSPVKLQKTIEKASYWTEKAVFLLNIFLVFAQKSL